jgi:hypothetical protein
MSVPSALLSSEQAASEQICPKWIPPLPTAFQYALDIRPAPGTQLAATADLRFSASSMAPPQRPISINFSPLLLLALRLARDVLTCAVRCIHVCEKDADRGCASSLWFALFAVQYWLHTGSCTSHLCRLMHALDLMMCCMHTLLDVHFFVGVRARRTKSQNQSWPLTAARH